MCRSIEAHIWEFGWQGANPFPPQIPFPPSPPFPTSRKGGSRPIPLPFIGRGRPRRGRGGRGRGMDDFARVYPFAVVGRKIQGRGSFRMSARDVNACK
jgi:hypothetical protein